MNGLLGCISCVSCILGGFFTCLAIGEAPTRIEVHSNSKIWRFFYFALEESMLEITTTKVPLKIVWPQS